MPEPSITNIGLGFHFLKINIATVNNKTETKFIDEVFIEKPPSPQTASVKIDKPADAISATMVGLMPDNTPCTTINSLYLK